jgi:peptidylprolyl isomerase
MSAPRGRVAVSLFVVAGAFLAACGSDENLEPVLDTSPVVTTDAADDTATGADDTATAPESTSPDKPEVELPAELPTELVVTDLVEGTGDPAEDGDTVTVNYVGVRSEDGTEFDNSYDRGQPFSVTLGAGMVIAGWDQGLVGVKQGGQRQLDIPTDLAYGDSPQGDVIQPGDALTFVVDVVAVIPKSDPADAPTVEVEAGTTVDSLAIEDLEAGEGDEVETGQTVAFDYIFIRTDTGEQLESSWETGSPQTLPFDEAQLPPVLFDAFAGVKVGTVRKVSIPFAEASELFQLPGDTDIVLVIRVNAIY